MLLPVLRFELRYHRREFLTWLAAVVFLLLAGGFMATGAVELVRGRGALPRTAPWIVAQAMAGITAFGQVITTMIAATAVLRDDAARTRELLFATRLGRGDYLAGRFLGAVVVMLLVYLAIPLGLAAGALAAGAEAGAMPGVATLLRPWAILVVPNVLAVTALLFAAGTLGGGVMTILLAALGLVALWQTGTTLEARTAHDLAGALLDPFGNAALAAATGGWSDAERAARQIPWGGPLLANRLLWLAVGAAAAAWTFARYRLVLVPPAARRVRTSDAAPTTAWTPRTPAPLPAARQALALARVTARWTFRERGYLVLALLALLNATANAWNAAPGGTAAVLDAVHAHSRVFLILVATIYAGELVWRERDVRAAGLLDALPLRTGAIVAGKVAGIVLAEAALVGALLLAALLVQLRSPEGMSLGPSAAWAAGGLLPTVALLTLLSLAVHAVVQRKVVAHLLLVAGWAVAVTLADAHGAAAPVRAALAPGAEEAWWAWGWSGAVAVGLGAVAAARWRRGETEGSRL